MQSSLARSSSSVSFAFGQIARPVEKNMPNLIVRLEGDLWRIRPDQGELDAAEQQELRDYFDEIRMAYRIEHGSFAFVATFRGRHSTRHSNIFMMAALRLIRFDCVREPNKSDAANPAIASGLQHLYRWRGVADTGRSAHSALT